MEPTTTLAIISSPDSRAPSSPPPVGNDIALEKNATQTAAVSGRLTECAEDLFLTRGDHRDLFVVRGPQQRRHEAVQEAAEVRREERVGGLSARL